MIHFSLKNKKGALLIMRNAVAFLYAAFNFNYIHAQTFNNNGTTVSFSIGTVISGGHGNFTNTSGVINNNGILTFAGNLTNSGVINGNGTYTIGGAFAGPGTFNCGSSSVNYNGVGTQTIQALNYAVLNLSNSGSKVFPSGMTGIAIALTVSGASPDAITNFSTINYNGSGAQNVTALTYYNLTCSNNGVKTAIGNIDLNNLFILSGSAAFDADGAGNDKVFTLISTPSSTASIGPLTVPANFTGNITMQRCLSGVQGYRYIGAAIGTAIISSLTPAVRLDGFTGTTNPAYFPNLYTYTESIAGSFQAGWTTPTNVTNPMTTGMGFALYLYAQNNPATLKFTGPINKGTLTLPVTYNNSLNTDDGWNLVSNPFPSAIDWDASVGWTRTNILGNTYYLWDEANNRYASYPSLGPGVNGGTRYIPSSQGFLIKAGPGPLLLAAEDIKVSNEPSPGFWKMQTATPPAISIKTKALKSPFEDEVIVRFIDGATNKYDMDLDAVKLARPSTKSPYISTYSDDAIALCVNTISPTGPNISIPVLIQPSQSGVQIISIEKLNYSDWTSVILEDMKTGTKTAITNKTSLNFTMDTAAQPEIRFLLHIAGFTTGTATTENKYDRINTFVADGYLRIDLQEQDFNKFEITAYNLVGQQILKLGKSDSQNNIKVDLNTLPSGPLLLVFKGDQSTFVRKINFIR